METASGEGRSILDRRDLLDADTSDWKRKHGWIDDAYVDLVSRCVICLHSGRVNKIRRQTACDAKTACDATSARS